MLPVKHDRQVIRQRNLNHPEEYNVDQRRRPCIPRTIERLHRDHPPAIYDKGYGKDAQPLTTDTYHIRIRTENTDELFVEDEVDH